jgi:rare lipoprotein A (peptidoglycan hydrolase)
MNKTPHAVLRSPALAALTIAASVATPALAQAPAPSAPALNASMLQHTLIGSKVKVKGRLAGPGGQPIVVQRSKGHGWRTVAHAATGRSGRFVTRFTPRQLGRMKVRVLGPAGSRDQSKITVYRQAAASWYGPGFYGSHLACGGTMSPTRIGVANKTLPCGTKVLLRYHGRNVVAPVIDRGPYVGGRVYDLTAATKNRLHFAGTGTVWSSK